MVRLGSLAFVLTASTALAARDDELVRSGGPGCCSLVLFLLFVWIYRSGGVGWGLSLGAAWIPGIFGWFVWRNREHGTGARWVAVIFASLQVFAFMAGLLAALLAPVMLRRLMASSGAGPSFSKPVDLSTVREDPALGLHPPATFTTDPPGATVFVNGEKRGVTPLTTPLEAGGKNEVRLELDGYFPETQTRSPNAREELAVHFTLQPAARLEVTSTPPGTRVLVNKKEVLARAPGTSAPFEAGEVEVLVLAEGHQPYREKRTFETGTTPFSPTLEPGARVDVTSTPPEGEVFLDGQWVGLTPMTVFVPPKGKHALEVRKESWATATRTFKDQAKAARFEAVLVDSERVKAARAAAAARARYDRVEAALEKVQLQFDHTPTITASMERKRDALERDMAQAATALERAEARLKAIEAAREKGLPPPPVDEGD